MIRLNDTKGIKNLFKLMGVGLVACIIHFVYTKNSRDSKYPKLEFTQAIDGIILEANSYQSVTLVTLENNESFKIFGSRNYNYKSSHLTDFLQKGDHLMKKSNNDSLTIIRGSEEYLFIIGEIIAKE